MKKSLSLIVAICLAGVSGSAWADSNIWQGANTAGGASTDIDAPGNWSLGWVPKAGDTAVFVFADVNQSDLAIGAGSAFAPSAVAFNGGGIFEPGPRKNMYITVDKSLAMSNLVLKVYNYDAYYWDPSRLRIGTMTPTVPVTLTLTEKVNRSTFRGILRGVGETFQWVSPMSSST